MQEFSDVVIMFSSGNQLDTIAIDWMHSDKFREGRIALHQVDENQKFKLIISWSKTSKSVGLNRHQSFLESTLSNLGLPRRA